MAAIKRCPYILALGERDEEESDIPVILSYILCLDPRLIGQEGQSIIPIQQIRPGNCQFSSSSLAIHPRARIHSNWSLYCWKAVLVQARILKKGEKVKAEECCFWSGYRLGKLPSFSLWLDTVVTLHSTKEPLLGSLFVDKESRCANSGIQNLVSQL